MYSTPSKRFFQNLTCPSTLLGDHDVVRLTRYYPTTRLQVHERPLVQISIGQVAVTRPHRFNRFLRRASSRSRSHCAFQRSASLNTLGAAPFDKDEDEEDDEEDVDGTGGLAAGMGPSSSELESSPSPGRGRFCASSCVGAAGIGPSSSDEDSSPAAGFASAAFGGTGIGPSSSDEDSSSAMSLLIFQFYSYTTLKSKSNLS